LSPVLHQNPRPGRAIWDKTGIQVAPLLQGVCFDELNVSLAVRSESILENQTWVKLSGPGLLSHCFFSPELIYTVENHRRPLLWKKPLYWALMDQTKNQSGVTPRNTITTEQKPNCYLTFPEPPGSPNQPVPVRRIAKFLLL
jgi:hypothetical protein